MTWQTFRLRRGLWQASDESLQALLRLRLDRARGGVRMGRLTIVFCVFTAVVMLVLQWATLHFTAFPGGRPWYAAWRLFMLSSIWLLGCVLGSLVYIRRRRAEAAQAEQLLRELDSSE